MKIFQHEKLDNDFLPIGEILKRYEAFRKEEKLPDEFKVPLRTFRHWINKSIFYTPLHGRRNQALYPSKTIMEIWAIRILQISMHLTIAQIKDIFLNLPASYHEAIMCLDEKGKRAHSQLIGSHQFHTSR